MNINITTYQQKILLIVLAAALEEVTSETITQKKDESMLDFAKRLTGQDERKGSLEQLIKDVSNPITPKESSEIVVHSASIFRNDDSSALLVHLSDGASYRVGLSDPTQLRIGIEGLKFAFPKQIMDLDDMSAAQAIARGKINGLPVSYRMVEGTTPNPKTPGKNYLNMRLDMNLVDATEEQVAKIMGVSGDLSEL